MKVHLNNENVKGEIVGIYDAFIKHYYLLQSVTMRQSWKEWIQGIPATAKEW